MSDYPLFAGRYLLIKRLAVGGMGEIYLADEVLSDGTKRRLVVKRILRHMALDPMFVTMFTDEARVTKDLDHDNIVKVFEVGEAEGIYYITMEFLDGRDLAQVMGRAVKLGRSLGLNNALQVVHDIAAGAHYAHTFADSAGIPMNIVHRDLSPRNIMSTFDGRSKILDFGLAKARNQVNVTLPGKIKGTPSYLAPEQLSGKPVTPLTDTFALGTLLFELTTLRRLFRRGTTIDTMRAVKACVIPKPSTLVRRYPPAVEQIVLKALARHPEDRYGDAEQMRLAIETVMDQLGVQRESNSLGRTISQLFEEPSRELPLILDVATPDSSGGSTQADPPGTQFPIEASSIMEHRSNLPVHKTRFIGRDALLKAVGAAIDGTSNLVTLYGPPGTGKTRLALEFARSRIADYRRAGGVWFVEAEGLVSTVEVCAAVGGAMSVPLSDVGTTQDISENLGRALGGRGATLLMVDGVDRIVGDLSGTLNKWLAMAPELRLVVTTRRLMQLGGEHAVEVPPLALPKPGATANAPSTQLFIDRANLVRPAWKPSKQELQIVARLVNRLDGIPLAIELAASRMGDMEPARLLEQLA
ncbi:MAG: serine/threonine protein kinase, partial [Myxococcota bacterium]